MANNEHLKKLKEDVESWNEWRKENPEIIPDFTDADLKEINLQMENDGESAADQFYGPNLSNVNFRNADLSDAKLLLADLSGANLNGANLHKADLSGANLKNASLGDTNFEGATLMNVNFTGSYLVRVNFFKANLSDSDLSEADLSEANFSEANLTGTLFRSAKFGHTDFRAAENLPDDFPDKTILAANNTQKKKIDEGVKSWNEYFIKINDKSLNLHHLDFSGNELSGINLQKAVLWASNFSNANFSNADLSETDLFRANLRGANLNNTNLEHADLRQADLTGANLGRANLMHANMGNADLSHANLQKALLENANLRGAILENADFSGTAIFGAKLNKTINWNTANFSYDKVHLGKLREGVEVWNNWREEEKNQHIIPVLRGANLRDTNLEGANLSNAELWYADMQEAKLNGAKLTNARMKEVDLRWADLRTTFTLSAEAFDNLKDSLPKEVLGKLERIRDQQFETKELFKKKLKTIGIAEQHSNKIVKTASHKTDLSAADLLNADLRNATFDTSTKITKTNFKGAVISDEAKDIFDWGEANFGGRAEHEQKLREGVDAWNNWRKNFPHIVPILRGTRLKGVDFSSFDLSNVDLWNANLFGAILNGTNLRNSYLRNTDLREAALKGADLDGANLWATDLSRADLSPDAIQSQQALQQSEQEESDKDHENKDSIKPENSTEGDPPMENGVEQTPSEDNPVHAVQIRTKLTHANLCDAILAEADFGHADLSHSKFVNADLHGANFTGADMSGADLSDANLNGACLKGTDLKGASLHNATFDNADLSCANLSDLDLTNIDFAKADLTGVIVANTKINDKTFNSSKFNPDHLAKLNEGPGAWNAWRDKNPSTYPVLRRIMLVDKKSFDNFKWYKITDQNIEYLKHEDFNKDLIPQLKAIKDQDYYEEELFLEGLKLPEGVTKSEIEKMLDVARQEAPEFNLRDYNLSGADLRGANLEGIDFTGANLRYVNFEKAILRNAKLNKTKLRGASLNGAWLEGAELFGARIIDATLIKTDLTSINNCDPPTEIDNAGSGDDELKKGWLTKKRWLGKKIVNNNHRVVFASSDLSEAILIGAELEEADFTKANLTKADLSYANFSNATFKNTVLKDVNFTNAKLDGAAFGSADLSSANFSFIQDQVDRLSKGPRKWNTWRKYNPELKPILRDADLSEKDLRKFNLSNADLREANLSGTDLRDADLHGADLGGATLRKALLRRADLRGVNFRSANLREADLSEAKISGANFTKADLNSADLSYSNLQSSVTGSGIANKSSGGSGKHEKRTLMVGADLREADLYGANLDRADLSHTNLTQANLSRASLRESNLSHSDLRRVNLSGANLKAAKLEGANLSGANLIGAQYSEAELKSMDPDKDYSKYDRIRNLMDEIKEGNILIRNRTSRRIQIEKNLIVLPPFGERQISLNEYHKFNENINEWKKSSLITLDVNTLDPDKQIRFKRSSKYAAKSTIGKILNMLHWLFTYLGAKTLQFIKWFPRYFAIHFMRFLSFLPVLIIGIGFPAATIYIFGGGQDMLFSGTGISLGFLARSLQFLLIVITALLPVLLYYLFDRQQLGTLRENFYRNVLELDSKIMTLDDAKSIYGVRVAEVYGPEDLPGGKQQTLQQVTRLPILVATLVITLGWIITLMPVGDISSNFNVADLYKFLTPDLNVINFGFLGAYFFSINMIIRRYTRADLKPKTYSHITVRFLVVTILVWVISLLPRFGDGAADDPRATLMILAFFIGIVPETALTIIKEFLQKAFGKAIPSLNEKMPLTSLDGVTIYERARLEEEGIENIENLVYYDLIDLMLQTRIPLSRLIDWVDQGILHLHLWNELKDGGDKGESKSESNLVKLRSFGIRNASDLIEVYNRTRERDIKAGLSSPPNNVSQLLNILGPSKDGTPPPLETIYDALQNDEWLGNIIRWRSRNSRPGERAYTLDEMYVSFDELQKTPEVIVVSEVEEIV